ncbi:ComEC/Rec2-related protein [Pseudonocardia sp. Ae168_Ps1]|nr:ComEC/Rec2-related protein [Pseudonocardia sp. Ae150A_Ps1]OLL79160.1 ComEC/Rec2-related protein [Pseudonocardia sp. Ae168_Ps1]OLL86703.1 ComEC/Rec2-related protein [Pseudonocardia sp. Ae263_Ps1]OLL93251.1 ComEC/Rec2-related protein [Pseudonocardia sp. Ae356_Ps1]
MRTAADRSAATHDDAGECPAPPDLRLVPAALATWGAVLAGLLGGPPGGITAALLAAAAVLTALLRSRISARAAASGSTVVAAGGCALVAAVLVTGHASALAAHPLRAHADRGAAAEVRVRLTDDPRVLRSTVGGDEAGSARATALVPAELLSATAGDDTWDTGGRILLLAPADTWSDLLPGQEASAAGLLAPAQRPDLTTAVLRARGSPGDVTAPPWWQTAAGSLRDGLRDAAGRALPEAPAGLLPGLAVGDVRAQLPETEQDFRTAGLAHLTAVSGANVAIVTGAVLLLLRLFRADPRFAAAAALLALVGFVVLARPSPSVQGAAVMGAVVLAALAAGRARSAVPALASAVLGLLLYDPALAVDAGFALSVVATGALVLLGPGWTAALTARGLPSGPAEALVVPVAAAVATAPLIAGLNGHVGLVTIVANLLAAPAVAPATVLGVLGAVVSAVSPGAAWLCAWLAGPFVHWLVLVGDRAAAVPGATVPWPAGTGGALLLGALLLGLLAMGRVPRLRALLVALLVGLLIVLVPTRFVPPGWPPPGWRVVACDVGQGDALVLATGPPGHAVLVDTGPTDDAIGSCLDRLGVRVLDLVVITHLHSDHDDGLAGALRGRAAGGIAVGPVREPASGLRQLTAVAGRAAVPVVELSRGVALGWPGLRLDVLGPVHPIASVDGEDGTAVNDGSLVMRASTPAGSVLLTGDIELAAQDDLLASGSDLRADVLKLPHHGSRKVVLRWLDTVRPRAALISVGNGNTYRHPSPELVDRLERSGVSVARTDRAGDVAITGEDPGGLTLVARGDPRPAPGRRGRGSRPGPVRRGSGAVRQRLAHGGAGRGHGGRRTDLAGHRVERLEAVTGDHQDGLGVRVERACLEQLLRRGNRDTARGLGEHALGLGQEPDAGDDLVVGDVGDRATGAAHRVQDVRTVGRVADRQRAGDGVRLLRLDPVVAGLEGRRDRGAAGGLRAEHRVRRRLDQAQLAQLGEALVDLRELRAGRDRDDDLLRQPPAELLGDLEAQGLGALGVVGADVDVHERPVLVLGGQLGGEPVDVVVVAVDREQGAPVHRGRDDLRLLQRGGDEYDRVPAGARGGGRDGVGQVAGRGAAEHREAELAGGGERHRDHAVLEGVRGVPGVVLHPELAHPERPGQVVGLDELRQPGLGVAVLLDGRRDREEVLVAPDRLRAGLDRRAGHRGEVVGHLEGPETLGTGELRGQRHLVPALPAGEGTGGAQVVGRRFGHSSESHEISSSVPPGVAGRNWHRVRRRPGCARCAGSGGSSCDAGCRGFYGPFPLPLWMSHMRLCRPEQVRSGTDVTRTGAGPASRSTRIGTRLTGRWRRGPPWRA